MRGILLVLTVLAAAATTSCELGGACAVDCRAPGFSSFSAPKDGARDVPLNTRIWIGLAMPGPFTLTKVGGGAVTLKTAKLTGGFEGLAVLQPDAPLEPDADYALAAPNATTAPLLTFHTGTGTDTTPPPVPHELSRQVLSNSGSCGPTHGMTVRLASDGALLFLAEADNTTPNFDEATDSGSVSNLSFDGTMIFDNGPCGGAWPEAKGGAKLQVRFRAVDLAGNVSAWTPDETLALTLFD